MIFYWGIRGVHPELSLHNIFFSADYRAEFDAMFRRYELAGDLTVYVFVSARQVPSDAPAGHENWFVMVNAPPDHGQDWNALASRARQQVIGRLNEALGKDIEPLILHERVTLPPDIERQTSSWKGSLYGPSSNGMLSAFRRHPNQGKYPNLLHCGGSVHPGGGIPLCLLSGRIAADMICR